MKSKAEYLRDADDLIGIIKQDIPESTNERLRKLAAALWRAAREAHNAEHLHYCAFCRHRKTCSRIVRIRKGLS